MSRMTSGPGSKIRSGWYRLSDPGRVMVVGALTLLVGALAVSVGSAGRLVVGAAGGIVFIMLALTSRDLTLSTVVVWLALLGFVRRLLIPFAGWSENDPLLLLTPIIAIVFLIEWRRDGPAPRTMLSSLALFLTLWSVAEIFNPNEPSIVTGLKASIFYVVPLLWFFVGRRLTSAQHDRVLTTFFWVLIPVVGHGLYQTFFTLLPFEFTWVGVSGFGESLFLPGFKVRPFSTLVSPQEYGIFVSFGIMIIVGRLLYGHGRRWPQIAFLITSIVALFLQGSRSIFLFCVLGIFVQMFVRLRSVAATFGIVSVLALLVFSATAAAPVPKAISDEDAAQESTVSLLVNRQLTGLLDPGGESSTGALHLELIIQGFRDGLENPLGRGISAASIVSQKEGEAETSAESDVAQIVAVFGPIAGMAYVIFLVMTFIAAVRLQRNTPSIRHVIWVGILVAGANQWWSGALYSTSTILFMITGGIATETALGIIARHRAYRMPAFAAITGEAEPPAVPVASR